MRGARLPLVALALAAAIFLGSPRASAQPAVVLEDDSPASSAPAPEAEPSAPAATPEADAAATEDDALSLEIVEEPDGRYVALPQFLEFLKAVDPRSTGEWDNILGVLRIRADGKDLQALSRQPLLIVNNRTQRVARPIRVRAGSVLVPLDSVGRFLEELGLEIELGADEPPTTAGPVPAGAAAPAPAPLSPVRERPAPTIDVPRIGDEAVGLSWGDLADGRHGLPRRIVVLCDPDLESLAGRVAGQLGDLVEARVVPASPDRTSIRLVERINDFGPDLVVDLLSGTSAPVAGWQARTVEVWAVHEASWGESAMASEWDNAFRPHQFHGLALCSTLRARLVESHPEYTVPFELVPTYLARRIDAPTATIVVPYGVRGGGDALARAVAAGVGDYRRGLEAAVRVRGIRLGGDPVPAVPRP